MAGFHEASGLPAIGRSIRDVGITISDAWQGWRNPAPGPEGNIPPDDLIAGPGKLLIITSKSAIGQQYSSGDPVKKSIAETVLTKIQNSGGFSNLKLTNAGIIASPISNLNELTTAINSFATANGPFNMITIWGHCGASSDPGVCLGQNCVVGTVDEKRLDLQNVKAFDTQSGGALKKALQNALGRNGVLRIASCGHIPDLKTWEKAVDALAKDLGVPTWVSMVTVNGTVNNSFAANNPGQQLTWYKALP